jgi:hypothetical protein
VSGAPVHLTIPGTQILAVTVAWFGIKQCRASLERIAGRPRWHGPRTRLARVVAARGLRQTAREPHEEVS